MKKRIVEAALRIAAQTGYAKATTKAIAKRAGCSEGIIYHYFRSKRELYLEMLRQRAAEFRAEAVTFIAAGRGARERLERVVDFHFMYFTREGGIFEVLFGKSGDSTISMAQIIKIVIYPYAQIVRGVIEEGVREGVFRVSDAETAAATLLGMMQMNIFRIHFRGEELSTQSVKDTIRGILFGGILEKRGGRP